MSEPEPNVLLVDDAEANLIALEGILGHMPCELMRARSGNEALRLLLRHDFAVVLLDVQMPEMDGYEVAHHVHANPDTRQVPIIFVTAMHETPEAILRGYDAGAFDFLFKPIDPYVLRSKVQVFLDLYLGRRQLRAEIEAHKQTLEEVEAFNYSVSHDLRAPLRPLEGFSSALIDEYGERLDEQGRHYLARIQAGARRMTQLIDDMLELSRVSRVELRRSSFDLSALVEMLFQQIGAENAGAKREVTCAAGLRASGDPRLLRIVLENLLRNAWKFTDQRPTPRIEFGHDVKGKEDVYFVRDNGVGFNPARAAKLFRPFQRLHGSEFAGTGIGLAIVDRIIRRHKGRIWAESRIGEGATFLFTLQPPGELMQPTAPAPIMNRPLRVLLVEDSPDDAELIRFALRQGGYDPISVRVQTKPEMAAALQSQDWDLVLSDYAMPEFSAPEAFETLHESKLDLPFIIVSGTIGDEVAVQAQRLGVRDYIAKADLARLSPAIEREMRERTARDSRKP